MKKLTDFGPLELTNPSQIGFRLGEFARAGQLTAEMLDGLEGGGIVKVDDVFKGFLLAESLRSRAGLLMNSFREDELPVEESLHILEESLELRRRATTVSNQAADELIHRARRKESPVFPLKVNVGRVVQQLSQPKRQSFGRLRSR